MKNTSWMPYFQGARLMPSSILTAGCGKEVLVLEGDIFKVKDYVRASVQYWVYTVSKALQILTHFYNHSSRFQTLILFVIQACMGVNSCIRERLGVKNFRYIKG